MSDTEHILSYYDPAVNELEKALRLARSTKAAPEVIQSLESACELVKLREQFTHSASSKESDACKNILAETYKHDWRKVYQEGKTTWQLMPLMMSGLLEGQFLKSIISIQKAKRILEIGMFTGYSALSMAEALPADGELVTLDQDEYLKSFVGEQLFKKSPHHKKITIKIGHALNTIKQMSANGEQFDIIFLDASQSEYLEYFKYIFEKGLLSPGGTVLMDNAYMQGSGYASPGRETVTNKVAKYLAADASLHKVLVPLRDGILMIRRLADVEKGAS
ncbi:uncharacterized protein LOC131941865 isoform X2 [Physella acuta]|nr:uncharacterized protein LOC131941865 isoform X2 [Physella acuta]XP_059157417.1 uncharacterized protein LOC131941865 isoform X2 [Physella acuta]